MHFIAEGQPSVYHFHVVMDIDYCAILGIDYYYCYNIAIDVCVPRAVYY